jgi:hypothetical protein
LQKGHLHDVGALVAVVDHAVDERVQRALIAFDQSVEVLAPSRQGAANESCIVHWRRLSIVRLL